MQLSDDRASGQLQTVSCEYTVTTLYLVCIAFTGGVKARTAMLFSYSNDN